VTVQRRTTAARSDLGRFLATSFGAVARVAGIYGGRVSIVLVGATEMRCLHRQF